MAERLLTVDDLSTHFFTYAGVVKAVNGVSFTLDRKETLGIVGESGSGKTVAALSIMRLIPDPPGKIVGGDDRSSAAATCAPSPTTRCAQVRGNDIAMIFQDPMTSLNPVFKVGDQIAEAIMPAPGQEQGRGLAAWPPSCSTGSASPTPSKRVNQYPFEFSGRHAPARHDRHGHQLQPRHPHRRRAHHGARRHHPGADHRRHPRDAGAATRAASSLITHDLGVVAEIADKVMVMYGGRTVEYGPVDEIYYNPHHPYTWGLLGSLPRLDIVEKTRLTPIKGQPPDLIALPAGCPFVGPLRLRARRSAATSGRRSRSSARTTA